MMARAEASPTRAASVRILFIRVSGANGFPFWIPTEAQKPRVVGSIESVEGILTRSVKVKESLLAYNEDDCVALELLSLGMEKLLVS